MDLKHMSRKIQVTLDEEKISAFEMDIQRSPFQRSRSTQRKG